jgi:5-methylcytosine-specific restriction endonuclease McrA
MKMNILATAAALSDHDLLAHIDVLAARERETSAELVAHLAALDARPSVYAAKGYGSLFAYCTQALRLSEDAACNRIAAARACRRFPVILDLLASGAMTLTSVRLLGKHLTGENHRAVLARANGRSREEIENLVAELAPQPDVPTSVRKLPTFTAAPSSPATPVQAATSVPSERAPATAPSAPVFVPAPRPIVQATAPERYRVQFTIGQETHQKLRRVQGLLRREIPDGDPGAIFDRALTLLLQKVERTKLGAAAKSQPRRSIRPETDREARKEARRSRDVPRKVKRVIWRRDGGQCAFVSPDGRRCTERSYLEFHHVQAYAKQGPSTVENIALRCRRHNVYEAELVFGSRGASIVREARRELVAAAS